MSLESNQKCTESQISVGKCRIKTSGKKEIEGSSIFNLPNLKMETS